MTIDTSNSLKIQETTMRVYLYSIRHDIFTYSHRFLLSIFLLNDDIIFKLHFILLATRPWWFNIIFLKKVARK